MENTVNTVAGPIDKATMALGVQLAVAAGFVLLMVVIHGLGLLGISRLLKLNAQRLKQRALNFSAFLLVGATGVLLFLLHILEICVFAGFYLSVDTHIVNLAQSLFYSASAYATLGTNSTFVSPEWELIGALEGLVGFVLIGWSTAFVARTMSYLEA